VVFIITTGKSSAKINSITSVAVCPMKACEGVAVWPSLFFTSALNGGYLHAPLPPSLQNQQKCFTLSLQSFSLWFLGLLWICSVRELRKKLLPTYSSCYLCSEDGGNICRRNIFTCLPKSTKSLSEKMQSSYSPLRKFVNPTDVLGTI